MKKRIHQKKLSRSSNKRKQLLRNLVHSLLTHGFIETSLAKAQFLKPQTEKLVTMAKDDSLSVMQALVAETGSVDAAKKLRIVGEAFKKRNGGYLRLFKTYAQMGDNTQRVRVEWVEQIVTPEIMETPQKQVLQNAPGVKKIKPAALPEKKVPSKKTKPVKANKKIGAVKK